MICIAHDFFKTHCICLDFEQEDKYQALIYYHGYLIEKDILLVFLKCFDLTIMFVSRPQIIQLL